MPEVNATPANGERDARKLVKSTTPGIYKRVKADGTTADYAVIYRAGGKQRREYARTLDAARKLKREREADRDRGEFQERTTVTFRSYLSDWIDSYQGNGRTTFRENTREEYRRLLDLHAHVYFGSQLRLVDVTPKALNDWVRHLAKPRDGKLLSTRTIRNIVAPVRSAFSDAKRQGMFRHNPATDLVVPKRTENTDLDDDEQVNALSAKQLATLLLVVPPKYRLLVRFTASTGLRISGVAALQRKHLKLDGTPHVIVRRAFVKGKIDAPKSKNGKRKVLLPTSLVESLRAHVADHADDDLVFQSRAGTMIDSHNLRRRVLKTAAEEACVPCVPLIGWHTLRHKYASLQLAAGANMLQLSKALGHATPAFTLSAYCHLLPGGEAAPLDVDALVPAEDYILARI